MSKCMSVYWGISCILLVMLQLRRHGPLPGINVRTAFAVYNIAVYTVGVSISLYT